VKHTWNKTQIKALKSSILHWIRIVSGKRRKFKGELEGIGSEDCACCKAFKDSIFDKPPCRGCPVSLFTKNIWCEGTPHNDVCDAKTYFGIDSPEFKAAAEGEVDFLNKVLKAGIKEGR